MTIIFRLEGPTGRLYYEQCRGSFSHVDRPILAFDNININIADHFFHIHGAGSMRTGAASGAETIHFNGEVLEYQI